MQKNTTRKQSLRKNSRHYGSKQWSRQSYYRSFCIGRQRAASRSNARLAYILFNFEFSSSSCFNRFKSLDSIPEYLLFHLQKVWRLIPLLRHSSSMLTPFSQSFRIFAICSGLNLLFFIMIYYNLKLIIFILLNYTVFRGAYNISIHH